MEQLKYNRLATDVYGYSDLNRVETWIQSLSQKIKSMGYNPPSVKSKTIWSISDIPRQSDIDGIRQSIVSLRDRSLGSSPALWRYYTVGSTTIDKTEWDSWEWDLKLISDYVDAALSNMTFREANTIFMISGGVFN